MGYRGQSNPYTSPPAENKWRFGIQGQLIIGGLGFIVLLLAGIFANKLPLQDPNHVVGDVIHVNGANLSSPPFPPSFQHLLGTDTQGRDLLSRCIHGILPTFGQVAIPVLVILLVAAALAMAVCVWELPVIRHVVSIWNTVFSFIPRALAALLMLEIPDIYWYGVSVNVGHVRLRRGVIFQLLWIGADSLQTMHATLLRAYGLLPPSFLSRIQYSC